jgi:ATP-dependent helicase HrpA
VPNEAPRHNPVPLLYKHDPDLPIFARRQDILEALERHQLLIVAGDTGSGKSTQLPKYCLELGRGPGRGRGGVIAHTQPRRLAARSLAARIAEELAEPVGRTVGFRVRFADQVSEATRLQLMTDGLLLAELNADPDLRRYDTLIVDEAHERSLNVDLLLGVVKRLLPRRPDLKVIVTSATLAVERVSRFFDDAPILTVSGRSHPIEVRYAAAPEDADDPDLAVAVLGAYLDIATTPGPIGAGDVLVFLPGEREIRDVADVLERELLKVEVLPLFSRLSWEQQSKIFKRGPQQRIVLATNVAETSITVPGIRAVIDSGLARISRYSPRNRLQRLPIEPVSRASAEQRKGRCGRIGAGLCVRLYAREDFEARPEFTEPEVLRTNLAALLLRLAADGLGEAETFPFIDPPESRALSDGYRLLQELEALDGERRITSRGRAMARLPLDPRLARALLESRRYRAESELLALVAGLSVPDVRARAPVAKTPVAKSKEESGEDDPAAAFDDPRSEFSGLVRLWRSYRKARQGPRRELRRWCKERQLSLLRLSEWDDVYAQVADRAAELSIVPQARAASYAAVHRSLLAGFCTNVGVRGEEGEYLGTRGVRFHIFPGSPLRRRKPKWVMAGYIVETSRVYARRVAEIEPSWVEAAARHLLKREYLEPDWDEAREQVIARERITFLGLTLSANRIVNYGPIAPEESRLIFAREALVYGRLGRRPEWLMANDAARRDAELLEERLRVRDLVQPAEHFVELYARLLPRQVSSAAALEHLTRHLSESQRQALTLTPEQIFARAPERERLDQFPRAAAIGDLSIPVDYRFAPGEADDGATLRVPLLALPTLSRAAVDAAIPGLIEPRVSALLRSLPKEARRTLIPIAAAAQAFLAEAGPRADAQAVRSWIAQVRGVPESLAQFDPTQVPRHLEPRVLVVSRQRELGAGTDLGELRRRFALEARRELDEHARRAYPGAWRRFEAHDLPESRTLDLEEGPLRVYPALVRSGGALEVRLEWSAEEAARGFRDGAVALARLMLDRQARDLEKRIGGDAPLLLSAVPYFTRDALVETLLDLVFRRACFAEAEPPRERAAFEAALDRGRAELHSRLEEIASAAAGWFAQGRDVRRLLDDPRARALAEAAQESRAHLERVLDAAFLRSLPADWLRQVPRWLRGEERRWQRALARGSEPAQVLAELREWERRSESLASQASAELRRPPELDALRLWIEEYRVSLYAQDLKTVGPVSAARLAERAQALAAWLAR